jgi:hypothetical protein
LFFNAPVHLPDFYVIAMAILSVLFFALQVGIRAITAAHRLIALMRDWRDFRRGE